MSFQSTFEDSQRWAVTDRIGQGECSSRIAGMMRSADDAECRQWMCYWCVGKGLTAVGLCGWLWRFRQGESNISVPRHSGTAQRDAMPSVWCQHHHHSAVRRRQQLVASEWHLLMMNSLIVVHRMTHCSLIYCMSATQGIWNCSRKYWNLVDASGKCYNNIIMLLLLSASVHYVIAMQFSRRAILVRGT